MIYHGAGEHCFVDVYKIIEAHSALHDFCPYSVIVGVCQIFKACLMMLVVILFSFSFVLLDSSAIYYKLHPWDVDNTHNFCFGIGLTLRFCLAPTRFIFFLL